MNNLDAPTCRIITSLASKFTRRKKYVRYIEREDYLQEGFLKVWAETVKRNRPMLPVEAYVAARWAMSLLERNQAGRWTGEARRVGYDAPKSTVPPPDHVERMDIADALDLLTTKELEVVYNRHWLGFQAKEQAERLGLATVTINKRMESAHRKIRVYLDCYSEGYSHDRTRPRNWRVYPRYRQDISPPNPT